MGSMPLWEFFCGDEWAWHMFDAIIVTWSVIIIFWDVPQQFAALRTLRVLRVFVLFRKFKGLNHIVRWASAP